MIRPRLAALAAGLGLALAAAGVPAMAQTTVAETPIVIGTSYALPSSVYGGRREINVWLPPGYDESDTAYPVLYLLDGGVARTEFSSSSGGHTAGGTFPATPSSGSVVSSSRVTVGSSQQLNNVVLRIIDVQPVEPSARDSSSTVIA